MDEIELKRQSIARQINGNAPVVSTTYNLGLSKTVSGSYVNNLDVPTGLLPGNFGCRVLDHMMPTDLSDVYRERKCMQVNNFVCDNRQMEIPELMEAPKEVDYLTDDESDEGNDFEIPVPELDDLLKEFEADDDVILKQEADLQETASDFKRRGFEQEPRAEIKQKRIE